MGRQILKDTIPHNGDVYKVYYTEGREQPYSIYNRDRLIYFARTEEEVVRYIKVRGA